MNSQQQTLHISGTERKTYMSLDHEFLIINQVNALILWNVFIYEVNTSQRSIPGNAFNFFILLHSADMF